METLLQILPLTIYLLLIILIIIGIVLGIKLIITIDKVDKLFDSVREELDKITPIFDTVGLLSDKISGVIGSIVSTVENLIFKIFFKNKNKVEMEREDDE